MTFYFIVFPSGYLLSVVIRILGLKETNEAGCFEDKLRGGAKETFFEFATSVFGKFGGENSKSKGLTPQILSFKGGAEDLSFLCRLYTLAERTGDNVRARM